MNNMQDAKRAYKQKNFGEAHKLMQSYFSSSDMNTVSSDAYYLMGDIFSQMGQHKHSLNYFYICLDLNQSHVDCSIKMSEAYFEQDKYQQAQRCLQKILTVDHRNPKIHFNLGRVFYGRKQFEKAKEHCQKCLELNQNYPKCHKLLRKIDKKLEKLQYLKQQSNQKLKDQIIKLSQQNEALKNTKEQNTCVVCITNSPTHANKTCGHLSVCQQCVGSIKQKCPICARNGEYMKIFFT